ncbi:MAG: DEAD/DEAH box helicase [Candidatus Kapabacteria bacterium]|nr:DEAD/DEAH box helicase [Ignavibacteriota bacterium]MCW5883438.1 DEAD/DEAH box helicase [Candidatus Kapabacteria bacterium]
MTFQEAGINPELIRAISELDFEKAMPVQEKVIPAVLNTESDIIALAQTGTGKTAAFGLPLIQLSNSKSNKTQTLILSPTRELCIQIANDLMDYAKYLPDIKIVPVYGGASIETQLRAMKSGAQIVVATPGRLIDLMERKAVKLNDVEFVVLDEADEMLNMGFTESIKSILSAVPKERRTFLFSATMPPEIANIAKKYMSKPMEITVGAKNSGADNIKHICYTVHAKDKYETLKRVADYYPDIYGIVFCRTRIETQEIADKLISDGYNAEPLHGDMSQPMRDTVMSKFRNKTVQLLVATDVAARGIDVDNLTHVINYNLPEDVDAYNHRSGRTGRAGKAGISIAITNLKEKYKVKQIESKIGKQFNRENVPTGKEVCEKQLFHLIDRIEHIEIEHSGIEPYLPIIYKKLGWLDKEDLIKRLVSVEFNRFLQYYKDSGDLNVPEYQERESKGGKKKSSSKDSSRDMMSFTDLFINVGKSENFTPGKLIELLNKANRGTKFKVGRIDITKSFTVFGVETDVADVIIHSMNGMKYENRKLVVKFDGGNSKSSGSSDKKSRRKK